MYLQENIVYELVCDIKVTYNTAKIEDATFKVCVDAFTREYSIDLVLGSKVTQDFCLVPSISFDLCTCKF